IGLLRAVETDDHRVELLPDLEALRPLLVAVAAKVAALDEADRAVVADLNVESRILHLADSDGHRLALPHSAASRSAAPAGTRARARARAAALELLHAERDPLLLDIDVEHLRLDPLTLAVERKRLLARYAPGDVRHVDHAVDVAVEADEQPELGRIFDLALDHRASRMGRSEGLPRIGLRLLEAERNPALLLVDLEDLHVHLLRGGDDLARVNVLLGPAHLRDVDEALDAR